MCRTPCVVATRRYDFLQMNVAEAFCLRSTTERRAAHPTAADGTSGGTSEAAGGTPSLPSLVGECRPSDGDVGRVHAPALKCGVTANIAFQASYALWAVAPSGRFRKGGVIPHSARRYGRLGAVTNVSHSVRCRYATMCRPLCECVFQMVIVEWLTRGLKKCPENVIDIRDEYIHI